jgi:hypothetical protein
MTDLPTLIDLLHPDGGSLDHRDCITAALHAGGFTIPCDECHGRGWVVEGQTWDWPYGEQVQCGRCHDGLLSVGILPTPDDAAPQQDLARWKAEATEVLDGWEKVWMLLGCPGPLGSSKAANVWRVVRDLIEADEPGLTE